MTPWERAMPATVAAMGRSHRTLTCKNPPLPALS